MENIMIDLTENNKNAKYFSSFYTNNSLLQNKVSINEISKEYPFYGYVKVYNYDIKFLMFSNNDDYVAKHYYWLGENSYESMSLKLWSRLSSNAKIIFDIGAYTGLYSLLSASVNRKSRIFSFEALERNYSRIIINKSVNELYNIYPQNTALSETDGEVSFYISTGDDILTTGASMHDRGKIQSKRITVESTSLDSFIKNNDIPEASLIKVDVEGAEYDTFKGMKNTLRDFSPHIICEFLHDESASLVTSFLGEYGYNFYQINDVDMDVQQVKEIQCATDNSTLNTFISKLSMQEINELIKR